MHGGPDNSIEATNPGGAAAATITISLLPMYTFTWPMQSRRPSLKGMKRFTLAPGCRWRHKTCWWTTAAALHLGCETSRGIFKSFHQNKEHQIRNGSQASSHFERRHSQALFLQLRPARGIASLLAARNTKGRLACSQR